MADQVQPRRTRLQRRHRGLRRVEREPGHSQGHQEPLRSSGLDSDAPRPLADRLRPRSLAEIVGQEALIGPDGALTRMLATRSLGSLVFWGPPGTGKTTVARLLAKETDLEFKQISAIHSGVAELKKISSRRRVPVARRGGGRSSSSTRFRSASTVRSRTFSSPSWRTAYLRNARRRDHREPVLRAQRRASFPCSGPRLQATRCRGASEDRCCAPKRRRMNAAAPRR